MINLNKIELIKLLKKHELEKTCYEYQYVDNEGIYEEPENEFYELYYNFIKKYNIPLILFLDKNLEEIYNIVNSWDYDIDKNILILEIINDHIIGDNTKEYSSYAFKTLEIIFKINISLEEIFMIIDKYDYYDKKIDQKILNEIVENFSK